MAKASQFIRVFKRGLELTIESCQETSIERYILKGRIYIVIISKCSNVYQVWPHYASKTCILSSWRLSKTIISYISSPTAFIKAVEQAIELSTRESLCKATGSHQWLIYAVQTGIAMYSVSSRVYFWIHRNFCPALLLMKARKGWKKKANTRKVLPVWECVTGSLTRESGTHLHSPTDTGCTGVKQNASF